MQYDRTVLLPQLIPLWPEELQDDLISRTKLVAKLEKACRRERRRGILNWWSYSLPRHRAMVACLEYEREALAALWKAEHDL